MVKYYRNTRSGREGENLAESEEESEVEKEDGNEAGEDSNKWKAIDCTIRALNFYCKEFARQLREEMVIKCETPRPKGMIAF